MKKLKRLKLNAINKQGLEEKEMNDLRGGMNECGCSCYWREQGGSTTSANFGSNFEGGTHSKQGCNSYNTWGGELIYCENCDESIGPFS